MSTPAKSAVKNYRPDIDGLRAVAVLAVVFYHARLSLFSGGFVGVDVFFVISGFLITSIIYREFREARFSFVDFYFRRVRRIFPALYVMAFATVVGSFFLTFPRDFLQVGRAAKYIAFFSSNHLFWHTQNDYWAQNLRAAQPLLHTWSLAVEEQFYIVIPILLLGIFAFLRGKKAATPAVVGSFVAISVASFAAAEYLLMRDISGAFYLLISRAWELLMGSLLAVGLSQKKPRVSNLTAEAMGFVGLALIAWAVFHFTHDTLFPGASALFPCVGTALVMLAGSVETESTPWVSRFLGTRPMVFIGLLSYSLYLWHWPIFIFARAPHWEFWGVGRPHLLVQFIVVAVFTLISWRFVEEPFRHWKTSRRNEWITLGVALVVMLALSALGTRAIKTTYVGAEFTQPIPAKLFEIAPIEKIPYEKWQSSTDLGKIAQDGGGIRLGEGPPDFAVLGDSFAVMWGEALSEWAKQSHASGYLLGRTGCPPLDTLGSYSKPECEPMTQAHYKFLKTTTVKKIVLIGAWNNIFYSGKESFYDSTDSATHPKKREYGPGSLLYITLERTLDRLTKEGYQVFVMSLPPGDPSDESPYGPAIVSLRNHGATVTYPLATLSTNPERERAYQNLVDLQKKYNFVVIDPTTVLCPDGQCITAENGYPINNDAGGHLTPYGSKKAVKIFDILLWEEI